VKVKLDIDESQFRRGIDRKLRKKLNAATRVGMSRVILAAKSLAVRKAPKVTGNLKRSIRAETNGRGLRVLGILRATASYARYVHDGTGIYGPRKDFIRSVSAGFGKRHYSTFSRGQKPQPFFTDAIEAVAPKMQAIFSEAMKKARD